ncbi:protein-l-isoaspartate(d-aspartate) o-methyltransferase [Anaeramoeba ignava]|uniref:protein-L-isoaspartate(D-aspartate) O-methyltransferase n=1 Tax=Anaeramoeba ignava TaxID=1746090 RepID=A0A9Q0RA76_ANAIG|nr:protein-l-isoaspartate(d-aspartate) o-methyltransferase [Anaeramoeba ignava]
MNLNSMVDVLVHNNVIESDIVEQTMRKVDRKTFVPNLVEPYEDAPIPCGFNATISAPHIYGIFLELLKDHLQPGASVLDLGGGTGYSSALFGSIVGKKGKVVSIEHIPELSNLARSNLEKELPKLWKSNVFEILEMDGFNGYPKLAPYDVILIGAACEKIPKSLLLQLKPWGRLLSPVGPQDKSQYLTIVDKLPDGTVNITRGTKVKFTPFTSKEEQLSLRY